MRKVVVAIDGSEVSKGVIRYALHYAAREEDVDLHFIHVMEPIEQQSMFFRRFEAEVPKTEDDVKKEFARFVRDVMKESGLEEPPKTFTHVVTGVPYDRIVSFAEETDADMIMIGHRGLSDVKRFFLGSVAGKVAAHAPCSVYVYRPKAPKQ
jgi:cyclic lactone autoinducer peptide